MRVENKIIRPSWPKSFSAVFSTLMDLGQTRNPLSRITIASYNIHSFQGVGNLFYPERTATVLKQLNANIIGLQEVNSRFFSRSAGVPLDYLAQTLNMTSIHGPTFNNKTGCFGNALLTHYPVLAVRHINLNVPRREPRAAIDVDLDLGEIALRVIVTHLGLNPIERRQQTERLLSTIKKHSLNQPIIMMGDFNEWFSYSRLLRQIRLHLRPLFNAPATFPSWFPCMALDRIWASPAHVMVDIRKHQSWAARMASDHLPIVASLDLSAYGTEPLAQVASSS